MPDHTIAERKKAQAAQAAKLKAAQAKRKVKAKAEAAAALAKKNKTETSELSESEKVRRGIIKAQKRPASAPKRKAPEGGPGVSVTKAIANRRKDNAAKQAEREAVAAGFKTAAEHEADKRKKAKAKADG